MKTAEKTLKKWYNPLNGIGDIAELQIVEAMKEYALSVAQKALENAVQSAESAARKERSMSRVYLKMYEAIESETNIPEEVRNGN